MPKKKIVVEFIFDKHRPTMMEDYEELVLRKIKLGKSTTLTDEERDAIAEHWGQSDTWHVDIHNDLLEVIDSGDSISYD